MMSDEPIRDNKARLDRAENSLRLLTAEVGNMQRQLGAIRKHLGLMSNPDYSLSKVKAREPEKAD